MRGKLVARADLEAAPLTELAALDDAAFRKRFAGGPIKRIGFERFRRNVMIAIGNSGDRELIDAAEGGLDSNSPVVRGAAVWALGRLCGPEEGRALARRRAAHEIDADVIAEWRDAFPR